MSCMYCHLSGRSRSPFSSSAMARSGRPAPRGYASARNTAPNRYAMLNRGSSVVVMSRSGYSERKVVGGERRRRFEPPDRLLGALRIEPQLGAAVVLNRADPVDVGEQRRCTRRSTGAAPSPNGRRASPLSARRPDRRARAPPAPGRQPRAERRARTTVDDDVRREIGWSRLLEVPAREHQRRDRQQHGDVQRGVGARHARCSRRAPAGRARRRS